MQARSSAWTLALIFTGLVLYASLYPFEGWRAQGVSPLAFLWAPWPQYWTGFDLWSNLVGYMPLGFLLALGMMRAGWGAWSWPLAVLWSLLLTLLVLGTQAIALQTRQLLLVSGITLLPGALVALLVEQTLDRGWIIGQGEELAHLLTQCFGAGAVGKVHGEPRGGLGDG